MFTDFETIEPPAANRHLATEVSDNSKQTLINELEASICDLIEHYTGVEPILSNDELTGIEPTCLGTIGFGHDCFRGSVTLLTNAETCKQLCGPDTGDLADWVGELCNQLVGRLKNKLVKYRTLMKMGVPTSVIGHDVNLSNDVDQLWNVKWNGCHVTLAACIAVGGQCVLDRIPDLNVADEGSICLF